MEQTVCLYKSRRNHASLIETAAGPMVKKQHRREDTYLKELLVYRKLRGKDVPCAEVVLARSKTIWMTKLPGKTLVEVLEEQERAQSVEWSVWDRLVDWLISFSEQTRFVMSDANLRNFIYDEQTKILYGVDFEECAEGSLMHTAARLAAFIRVYAPENTWLKQEISRYILQRFSEYLHVEAKLLLRESKQEEEILLMRRKERI